MSDRITTADVVHVAKLARLALTDDEIARTTAQLGDMLEHFADIDDLDLAAVVPMTQPYPLSNVLRDDVVQPGLDRDEVLAAAPDTFEGRFRVPPIIGLGGVMAAVEIAAAVRSGTRTAVDVLEEHLAAIDAREGKLHAFNTVLADEAQLRRQRSTPQSPPAGTSVRSPACPWRCKDNMCRAGIPTTCSSKILEGWRPPYDATVVQRLRDAGAVLVGKTNLDEFAMGSSTENSAFGPTRNPHRPSACLAGRAVAAPPAVAAGFAAVSLGSDTGGSIRQPARSAASWASSRRTASSAATASSSFASSLDQIGPFTTTVADAALVTEVIGGHDPADSTSIPLPAPTITATFARRRRGAARRSHHRPAERRRSRRRGPPRRRVRRPRRRRRQGRRRRGARVHVRPAPPTTLIAPAEASSNLARYDGVRYGLRGRRRHQRDVHGDT